MDSTKKIDLRTDDHSISDLRHDKCDKYDYLIAAGCGVISGLVDIFVVGSPSDSILQPWTDTQVDKTVMKFSKFCGWNPRAGNEQNVNSAIGFLENKFKVNYDQKSAVDVGNAFQMGTKNHHLKSLSHSPDIIGLFFSILNQFTSTSTFLNNGQLITIQTDSFELHGNNLFSKLFCGIANWFGHIMSDIAGSSGSVGRGTGISVPFFELFQMCNVGHLQVGQYRNTIAKVATKVFQEGYDARFAITMSLPVLICDLSIKLIWALKHFFYHKCPLNECIPSKQHADLRVMLLVGNGVLCIMDGADALIRSGGNWVNFVLRLNFIAWCRLVYLVIREICIRLGLTSTLQKQLQAYKTINIALADYLKKLERLDIQRFREETEQYNELCSLMDCGYDDKTLNKMLSRQYEILGLKLPYEGNFDEFMKDKNSVLTFE